jgi:hypothetical protein
MLTQRERMDLHRNNAQVRAVDGREETDRICQAGMIRKHQDRSTSGDVFPPMYAQVVDVLSVQCVDASWSPITDELVITTIAESRADYEQCAQDCPEKTLPLPAERRDQVDDPGACRVGTFDL